MRLISMYSYIDKTSRGYNSLTEIINFTPYKDWNINLLIENDFKSIILYNKK